MLFNKTSHLTGLIGTACLFGAVLALPASATEPELELLCAFQPTRSSQAAAERARFQQSNAETLREEIASELAARHRKEQAEFASNPTPIRTRPPVVR